MNAPATASATLLSRRQRQPHSDGTAGSLQSFAVHVAMRERKPRRVFFQQVEIGPQRGARKPTHPMTTDAVGIVMRYFDTSVRHLRADEKVDLIPGLACDRPMAQGNCRRMQNDHGLP
jgi:hypothetical protein